MNANHIKIGTKFEVEIPDYNKKSDETSSCYISQLLDIVDDDTISIVAPMLEGRLKYLSKGLKVVIYYLNERQDLLCFNAIVKGHRKAGPLELFDLTIDGEFTRIQRRKYYRLDVALDCLYRIEKKVIINENTAFPQVESSSLKPAYIKNISGSGICLVLEESLEIDSVLDIIIDLEGNASIRVFVKVIRLISSQGKKYEFGMHFLKIEKRDSDILNKFIFEKQRILLRNSMMEKNR